jgi:nucleoside-diphosphate-sugar epimerase
MTKVLVTGANGFVGRTAVAALLRRGAEVHAVTRRPADPTSSVRWHTADLLNPHSIAAVVRQAAPDVVLHLAWIVEHGLFWTSTENIPWVSASALPAKEAHAAGASRFVGVGTCFEYDLDEVLSCCEHSTSLRPKTFYGVAKDATRRLVEGFAQLVGLSFAWARLFHLYGQGEGERRLVPSVARAILAGTPAKCSSGTVVGDFMDVRDAGDALAAITLGTVTGPVNVGTGIATSVGMVASMLGSLAGRPELVALGALADRPNEPRRIVADITRLMTETDATRSRSLEDGLRSALEYWAQRAGGGSK